MNVVVNHLLAMGRHYGVDPVGFAVLDISTAVLFWFAAAWLVAVARHELARFLFKVGRIGAGLGVLLGGSPS